MVVVMRSVSLKAAVIKQISDITVSVSDGGVHIHFLRLPGSSAWVPGSGSILLSNRGNNRTWWRFGWDVWSSYSMLLDDIWRTATPFEKPKTSWLSCGCHTHTHVLHTVCEPTGFNLSINRQPGPTALKEHITLSHVQWLPRQNTVSLEAVRGRGGCDVHSLHLFQMKKSSVTTCLSPEMGHEAPGSFSSSEWVCFC